MIRKRSKIAPPTIETRHYFVQTSHVDPKLNAIYHRCGANASPSLVLQLEPAIEPFASRLCAELESAYLMGIAIAQRRVRRAIGIGT
jgi:hypothetical protein